MRNVRQAEMTTEEKMASEAAVGAENSAVSEATAGAGDSEAMKAAVGAENLAAAESDFSLYTEKIVVSPMVRYKKQLAIVRGVMIVAVVLIFVCVGGIFANKYIKGGENTEVAARNPLVLEKDEYSIYSKSPTLESEEPDLSNYYNWFAYARRVISRSVVQIGEDTIGIIAGEVDGDYIVITEYNSAWGKDDYYVKVSEEVTVSSTLLNVDNDTGMALVAVDVEACDEAGLSLSVVDIGNSYDSRQNEIVIALGRVQDNPEGYATGFITDISTDSGIDMTLDILETNVELKAGDYAFVFNMNGELIGIANRKNEVYNEDSEHIIGISSLKPLIERMSTAVPVAYLGIRSTNITKDVADKFHFPTGIYVSGVELDSPAYKVGVQAGDIIYGINDEEITTVAELADIILAASKDDSVKLKIKRIGKDGDYREIEYTAKLTLR